MATESPAAQYDLAFRNDDTLDVLKTAQIREMHFAVEILWKRSQFNKPMKNFKPRC